VPSVASVQYGWLQVGGPAYVAAATSGTKGQNATQDLAAAGSVANSGASTTVDIGTFSESAASSLASVFLSINPIV
jgi:hypothetical protein